MWSVCWRLMRFDRPVGIWLLLWPTLWGLWVAGHGHPPIDVVLVFVCGVVIMRAAGCVWNDWTDQPFDGAVQRTKTRPLVSGAMTRRQAFGVLVLLGICAFGLVLSLNRLTVEFAFMGAALTLIYPWMKRFFPMPQLVLGLAFAWGIPMAFTAVQGHVSVMGWCLYVLAVVWIMGFDTVYAMVDREDDLSIGLHSSAITCGRYDRLFVGVCQSVLCIGWGLVAWWLQASTVMYGCVFLSVVLCVRHQFLIRHREPRACMSAFVESNAVGLCLFLGLLFL